MFDAIVVGAGAAGLMAARGPRVLARGFDDRIFLAGEAIDSGSSGTVEGAPATGKRAALKVLKSLTPYDDSAA